MPVAVVIRFPTSHQHDVDVRAADPTLMDPIVAAARKHDMTGHVRLVRDGEYIDIDTFPSHEAYQAFKSEAWPAIVKYEAALGITSVDEVWELVED